MCQLYCCSSKHNNNKALRITFNSCKTVSTSSMALATVNDSFHAYLGLSSDCLTAIYIQWNVCRMPVPTSAPTAILQLSGSCLTLAEQEFKARLDLANFSFDCPPICFIIICFFFGGGIFSECLSYILVILYSL